MNPQSFILAEELIVKAINFLSLMHRENHPKSFHDEVANVIKAIQQTAKPYIDPPEETVKEGENDAS